MGISFSKHFDQQNAWRRELLLRLNVLSDWMRSRDLDLCNVAVEDCLRQVQQQLSSEKVMVAFVAELSRGKSELINALFFADYGRRIVPTSVGRTTMCPTELGYDPSQPQGLRLLPIQTRLQAHALADWRAMPEQWESVELVLDDARQMASALAKVSEVCHVELDEARALGLWHDDALQDNPPLRADGRLEIPRWRHALVNIPHPLLQSGLVILDTPGLNAMGAEPELTMGLIPQAHAVVFVLAADTGLTKSDMGVWLEHLEASDGLSGSRIVALNKIDTLWDALSDPQDIDAAIARQCADTAEMLHLPTNQVVAVSAQKGLLAKITADAALLQSSRLQDLEQLLNQGVLARREHFLRDALEASVAQLNLEASRVIKLRRSELTEQRAELDGLRGKNHVVVKQLRLRIEREHQEFEAGSSHVQALRQLHLKLVRRLFDLLGGARWRAELRDLKQQLSRPGIPLGLKKVYAQTFDRLQADLTQASALSLEIEQMLQASFRQLNTDYGFSLQVSPAPELASFTTDLQQLQQSHLHYLGLGHALKLGRAEFVEQLVRALSLRLRAIYDSALSAVELWNKSAASQLDEQMRERRLSFSRRSEAIDRVRQAASGLQERIAQLQRQDQQLQDLEAQLQQHMDGLLQSPAAFPADLSSSDYSDTTRSLLTA